MEIGKLFSQNWFNFLSAIGIMGALYFNAVTRRDEAKTRRVANLLTLTQNHQLLWREFNQSPHLTRVLDSSADVASHPVTPAEEQFVNMAIQQLSATYQAMKSDLTIEPEGVRRDIFAFFSLPVPNAVWPKVKPLQNQDFAAFIESSLK